MKDAPFWSPYLEFIEDKKEKKGCCCERSLLSVVGVLLLVRKECCLLLSTRHTLSLCSRCFSSNLGALLLHIRLLIVFPTLVTTHHIQQNTNLIAIYPPSIKPTLPDQNWIIFGVFRLAKPLHSPLSFLTPSLSLFSLSLSLSLFPLTLSPFFFFLKF